VTDPSPANVLVPSAEGIEKRRGSRLMIEMPITVTGMDPLGEPFREETITSAISCYGCKYRTKRYAAKDSVVILEVPRPDAPFSPRLVHARVVWVQRPRHHRETFQIGLELEVPGNVWGIDAPPADWFPHPDDMRPPSVAEPVAGIAPEIQASVSEIPVVDVASTRAPEIAFEKPATAREWETLHLPETEPSAAREASARSTDAAALRWLIGDTVKATTDAMIEEEIALLRKHFTGRLESALVETLRTFSELTTEIVNDTREACRTSVKEVEAELQKFAEEAQRTVAEIRSPGEPTRTETEQVQARVAEATPARAASAGKKSSGKRRKKTIESAKQ
jgi:hypothetical protein